MTADGRHPLDNSPPVLPDRLWHPRVHEEWGEQLYFWRLAFAPTYQRDVARAGLKAAAISCGVGSIAAYEMFGIYDILLRVWIPNSSDADVFQDALVTELAPHGLQFCEAFAVEYTSRQWAFDVGEGYKEPNSRDVRRLRREHSIVSAAERGELPNADLQRLIEQQLFAVPHYPKPDLPGIKFVLIVSGDSSRILDGAEHHMFESEVTAIVESAAAGISERSLYAGTGFGHFIIVGRLEYRQFHELHSTLVRPLQSASLLERFGATTSTHVSGMRGLLLFSESLASEPFDIQSSPRPDLERGEGTINLRPGETFARRFHVAGPLGSGGFGSVFRVRDVHEGVEWALKLFPRSASEAAQRELSMLRRVQHEHIVSMYWGDQDPDTGYWYLVSELADGEPLEAYVRGSRAGELTDAEAVKYVTQVLTALEALHPRDAEIRELQLKGRREELTRAEFAQLQRLLDEAIVHRDIKPSNIIIGPDGVKLIDFGIASPARSAIHTRTMTPRYSPPAGMISATTWEPDVDLFAAGVVLYELLCQGQHPYETDESATVRDPRQFNASLSDAMAEVLVSACSFPPRYASAEEFRRALQAAWTPQPEPADR